MDNPKLTWTKSDSSDVTEYVVLWARNGSPAATVTVPQSAAGDTSGYSADFVSGNPGVTLVPGDTVGVVGVYAEDGTGQKSVAAVPSPASVTIPAPPPPSPPTSVTLTLS